MAVTARPPAGPPFSAFRTAVGAVGSLLAIHPWMAEEIMKQLLHFSSFRVGHSSGLVARLVQYKRPSQNRHFARLSMSQTLGHRRSRVRPRTLTTADLPGTLLTLWRVFSIAERLTVPSTARVALAKSALSRFCAEVSDTRVSYLFERANGLERHGIRHRHRARYCGERGARPRRRPADQQWLR